MSSAKIASERLIGMLIFPRLTQLDMTGPYEVLARLPNTKVPRGVALNEQRREVAQRVGRKLGVPPDL